VPKPKIRHGSLMQNIVINVSAKLHYDQLTNDKSLGEWKLKKSDNNNKNNNNKKTSVALGDPFPRPKNAPVGRLQSSFIMLMIKWINYFTQQFKVRLTLLANHW